MSSLTPKLETVVHTLEWVRIEEFIMVGVRGVDFDTERAADANDPPLEFFDSLRRAEDCRVAVDQVGPVGTVDQSDTRCLVGATEDLDIHFASSPCSVDTLPGDLAQQAPVALDRPAKADETQRRPQSRGRR